jgi:hypothetical protein
MMLNPLLRGLRPVHRGESLREVVLPALTRTTSGASSGVASSQPSGDSHSGGLNG